MQIHKFYISGHEFYVKTSFGEKAKGGAKRRVKAKRKRDKPVGRGVKVTTGSLVALCTVPRGFEYGTSVTVYMYQTVKSYQMRV